MKFITTLMALLTAVHAHAVAIDCRAIEISGGPLKDSFNTDEYSEVLVSDIDARLGGSVYSGDDNASVVLRENARQLTGLIITATGEESFEVVVNKSSKRGVVIYRTADENETENIAQIVCK